MRRIVIRGVGALGFVLCLVAAAVVWWYRDALLIDEESFAQRRALLEPHVTFQLPEGDQARPAALFFHGCGGPSPSDAVRAQLAVDRGYVAVIVDSLTPRDVAWRRVCAGRVLHGPERAGDVLAALAIARDHPRVDGDKLFLVGFSHGAWTVLEALALDEQLPPGLEDSSGGHLAGVRAAVAWYPYCGAGARFTSGWDVDIPVTLLLAELDEITAVPPCEAIALEQAARGKAVRHIVYPGVSHGFDELADWVQLFNADVRREAIEEQYRRFAEVL